MLCCEKSDIDLTFQTIIPKSLWGLWSHHLATKAVFQLTYSCFGSTRPWGVRFRLLHPCSCLTALSSEHSHDLLFSPILHYHSVRDTLTLEKEWQTFMDEQLWRHWIGTTPAIRSREDLSAALVILVLKLCLWTSCQWYNQLAVADIVVVDCSFGIVGTKSNGVLCVFHVGLLYWLSELQSLCQCPNSSTRLEVWGLGLLMPHGSNRCLCA